MLISVVALVLGMAVLIWSADLFVDGAAATSRHLGLPPLLIGMVVVGFGTSAPEMVVSAIAAFQGNPALALGNAYGSNISNIALILGCTAAVRPLAVHSRILGKELPVLLAVTALSAYQLRDGHLSRMEAGVLLLIFGALMAWAVRTGLRRTGDALGEETRQELEERRMTLGGALWRLSGGLVLLLLSSRALVWGAVAIARGMGVSDLFIGLTVVAVGTSLPELASSLAATRRGEDDIALGNIVGSNLFNTLAVVGIAGAIQPVEVSSAILTRDALVMGILTVALFGLAFRAGRRIRRLDGVLLLGTYAAYLAWLISTARAPA